MINRVELQNFQSHKDSSIDFHQGVNTFVGTSDHGKSSVMRAIQLVTENRPSGTGYVSNWIINDKGKPTDNTVVTVELDDGSVTRVKGVDNKYIVTIDGISKTYEAFGSGIVQEIVEYINFSDTNIQRQEDNFFLFAETSGEVMRRINSYTNLDLIDTVLSNADKDMSRIKREQKEMMKRIAGFEKSLSGFIDLEDREDAYQDALLLFKSLCNEKERFEKVQKHIAYAAQTKAHLEKFHEIERAERKIKRIETSVAELKEMKDSNATLSDLIYRYRSALEQYKSITVFDDATIVKQVKWIEETQAEEKELVRTQKTLTAYIDNFYSVESRIEKIEKQIERLEEEYRETLGDVCPICGSPIKGHV